MKTTEKTNKNANGNVKSDAISGISAGVGAAIGMVVGSGLAAEVNAAEVETPVVSPVTHEEPVRQEPVKPEPPVEDPVKPEPPVEEPEIIIEGCEVVVNPDGTMMEVAEMTIDGHAAMIVDGDMDGIADVMAVDMNGDNIVDDNEIIDVSENGLAMDVLREPDYTDIAQADVDYVNNADVQDYMA